jgi:hypothetical protein
MELPVFACENYAYIGGTRLLKRQRTVRGALENGVTLMYLPSLTRN